MTNKFRTNGRTAVACGLLVAVAVSAVTAWAQDEVREPEARPPGAEPIPGVAPTPSPGRRPQEPAEPVKTGPFQLGSFLLYPELSLTGFYDSNVFYSYGKRFDDYAAVLSPALWLQSNWDKHALNFHAGADFTRYDKFDTEDTDDYRVSAEGRYDFSIDSNVYGGIRYGRDHEDRESPDARNGVEPTLYYTGRGYVGYFRQIEQFSVRIAGTAQHLSYDDVDIITGQGPRLLFNGDRDRWQYTGGVRVGYEVSPRVEPFVQLSIDNRSYDEKTDELGFKHDSDGWRALGGVRYNLPRQVKLEAFAGYLDQNYDDSRFKDVSDPVLGGSLQWQASDRLRISAYMDRSVEETTVFETTPVLKEASSYLNTYVGFGASYRLLPDLTLQANASYSNADYKGISREDDYTSAGFGLVYRIERRLYLDVSYLHRHLDSSLPQENFDKNQIFVRLTAPLQH